MQTTRRQFLKSTGAAAAVSALGSFRCSGEKPPNIVLFFSDELAYDFISCYGGGVQTPNIDKLAREGLRFTHAYCAAPMCTPSRFGVLTGQYPGRCKHPAFIQEYPDDQMYSVAWNTYLDQSHVTLPGLLSRSGYLTGMSGKWHIGPETLGFPEIDADADLKNEKTDKLLQERHRIAAEQVKQDAGFDLAKSVSWGNLDEHPVRALRHHNFPWITKGTVELIQDCRQKNKPFFVYAATTAVHGPYHPDQFKHDLNYTPQGKLEDVEQYQLSQDALNKRLKLAPEWMHHKIAGMACLDHHVGQVMQTLTDLGIEDNTIVIFMGDHNIEPGKATCYEKGNRVPFIIKWPGHVKPGQVSPALVQSVDILPTLLNAAGITLPADHQFDGVDMTPLFKGSDQVRDSVYLESGYSRALVDGQYKYIAVRYPQPIVDAMKNGETQYAPNHLDTFKQAHSQIAIQHFPNYFDQDQLYDLKSDPFEQNNLAGNPDYAKILKSMKQKLTVRLGTFSHPYDLQPQPFLYTPEYKLLAKNTKDSGHGLYRLAAA
ncbi:MAG: sulfatase-like hydrolase/transferase [candidate division KSB1 bacterium]|nr:sulfatase-like hydrolase/transferase [candidate division KSB1 bacterium]